MTSTSAQSSSIKNEMKTLVSLKLIPVLCPRFQRPPFGFQAKDGQSDVLKGFPMGWRSVCSFEHVCQVLSIHTH